jgi:hypothetical protein
MMEKGVNHKRLYLGLKKKYKFNENAADLLITVTKKFPDQQILFLGSNGFRVHLSKSGRT